MNGFTEQPITYGQMNFIFTIRSLYRDQTIWTRAYLIDRYAQLDIADDVFNRLYRVPQQVRNLFQYTFGYDNAIKYAELLAQQIVLFRSLIDAEIEGNVNQVNQYTRQLYQLGDERASFLSSINSFWDETTLRNLIHIYIQYTLEGITARLTGEYSRSIDIFDRLLAHSDQIGNYLAEGILNYLTYQIPATMENNQ